MATTIPCKIHIPLRLPRPLNPNKTARPANCELVVGRADPSTYLHLLSLKSAAATRPNLHSLNSWPAVQCNEGFCNASEGQRLPLTTTMASQKLHHSANRSCLQASGDSLALIKFLLQIRGDTAFVLDVVRERLEYPDLRRKVCQRTTCQRSARASCYRVRSQFGSRGR